MSSIRFENYIKDPNWGPDSLVFEEESGGRFAVCIQVQGGNNACYWLKADDATRLQQWLAESISNRMVADRLTEVATYLADQPEDPNGDAT